jgi:hypothetical protein
VQLFNLKNDMMKQASVDGMLTYPVCNGLYPCLYYWTFFLSFFLSFPQRVVHTILERLERSVEHLGGSQAAPKTAIVIDEVC